MVTVRAHAKVNLFLHVLAREADGYHQIETLFCLLELHDEIHVTTGVPGLSLEVEGDATGAARDNLVWRAADAFFVRCGIRPNAHMRLRKRIPVAAGLGGGSSDAAAALHALNALHGSPLDPAALLSIGAAIGADVPFFVARTAAALGWGRGDRLLVLASPGSVPALVAAPAKPMRTGDAYGAMAERRTMRGTRVPPSITKLESLQCWPGIERIASNDFQPIVTERVPDTARIIAGCNDSGARIAMVSGSGSACFATFDDDAARDAAAARLRSDFTDVRVFETRCGVDPAAMDV